MNEYKTVPFSEVAVNQPFEDAANDAITNNPWIKYSETTFNTKMNEGDGDKYEYQHGRFPVGCLVRTADCDELDFDTWWQREGLPKVADRYNSIPETRELCHTAWENGAFKAKAN